VRNNYTEKASLAAVYCGIYRKMNLTLGEERAVQFSGKKSLLNQSFLHYMCKPWNTAWIDGKHEFLGITQNLPLL
jgi:hypothetical protein